MKRKILVLEDEENIRSFLVLNLKRSGYEVIEPKPAKEHWKSTMKSGYRGCGAGCYVARYRRIRGLPRHGAARAIRRVLSC